MSGEINMNELALHHRVSQFLFHEARLLDEQRWEEWERLFTDDGTYWAPAAPDQANPLDHVSLIYEDSLLRKVRIARFAAPNAYSLQPFPRSAHLVTNVMIDAYDADVGEIVVNSRFLMVEYRRDAQHFYAGEYAHDLKEDGASFKIARKKATLVNCDGVQQSSSLYF